MIGTIIMAALGYGFALLCAAAGVCGFVASFRASQNGDGRDKVLSFARVACGYLAVAFVIALLTRWAAGI